MTLTHKDVTAPQKWLTGWDKLLKKQLKKPIEQLEHYHVHYPVQLLHYYGHEEKSGKKVLEFACGDGRATCFLASLGYTVTAFDILPSAVELTKKRAKVLGLEDKITVLKSDMESFPLYQNEYDIIVALQCLQYLFDQTITKLREILSVIKLDGYFVYSGNILPHFDTDPPIRFITKEEMRAELAGWKCYSFGSEERIIRKDDKRGYLWTVAQKISK